MTTFVHAVLAAVLTLPAQPPMARGTVDTARVVAGHGVPVQEPVQEPFHEARRQADLILSQRQFQITITPEPWWRRPLAHFWSWVNGLLNAAAGFSRGRGWVGLLLGWGLVSLAIAGLATWCWRVLRREGLPVRLRAGSDPVAAGQLHGTDWVSLARQSAAAGEWREAIHAQYWACIVLRERRGGWRSSAARTPREYLRLLAAGNEREQLHRLTQLLEAAWYGNRPMQQKDWAAAEQLAQSFLGTALPAEVGR